MDGVPFRGIGERRVEEALPPARPEAEVEPVAADTETVTIRYSRYDPALGGVNCAVFRDDVCVSRMASGLPWEKWMERAAACPPEWPFWTRVILDGKDWHCLDRGGMVVFQNGTPWVDFLTRDPQYVYGELVEVEVIWP